jgi:hypothetical protein
VIQLAERIQRLTEVLIAIAADTRPAALLAALTGGHGLHPPYTTTSVYRDLRNCAGRRWSLLLAMALAVELAGCTLVQKF